MQFVCIGDPDDGIVVAECVRDKRKDTDAGLKEVHANAQRITDCVDLCAGLKPLDIEQAITAWKKDNWGTCIVCDEVLNYKPIYCCNGHECGCQGQADPMVCSNECYDEAYGNKDKKEVKDEEI